MSSSGAVDSASVSHYLHPDFLEPLPSSLDPKQNPLVLLAQTCNNIGKDVSFPNSKKTGVVKALEARLSSPPKLVSLRNDDQDKQPSSTSVDQRHSPTSTRSPKYAVTPEQAKSCVDGKSLSPGLMRDVHLTTNSPLKSAHAEDKCFVGVSPARCLHGDSQSTPIGTVGSPLASAAVAAAVAASLTTPNEKLSPATRGGDSKSPSSSQEPVGHASVGSTSFPFPLPHPALLSAAYSATMPWSTLPFPHLAAAASMPGLTCPCGQCGLGSPGTVTARAGTATPNSACGAANSAHCSCAHCLSHPHAGPQHSLMHDSFPSACFYSSLLNSYLGHHGAGVAPVSGSSGGSGAKEVSTGAAAPGVTSSAPTSCAPVTSTCSSGATPSRTVEYCMYCGKHCPSPEQLLAHLQCHMSTTDSISPPAPASVPPPAPTPGLSLYSSSAAADLIRKLYASSAVAAAAAATTPSPGAAATAAGFSPRFHPYRSFLPKLSPHRAPFQPFGTPLV